MNAQQREEFLAGQHVGVIAIARPDGPAAGRSGLVRVRARR